ncbi:hypothetical protein P5F02_05630 [Clostridium perfringens]|nr:hypothetical protein [Clostridium perfringens]MDK0579440.1 hypothetical protein [Clostridium perfringens]
MLKKLFLDLNNFKANLGSVERGDSIELNIKLLDDEDYSRSKFRVLGAKADDKYVEQIEGINLEEKDLKIVLEDQFVNCEGIVKLELNVVSGETEITTKEFYFFVSNTMNVEIIDSADSIPTLEKVSKYVDDAVNNLDALKEASEDITIINSEFKENEIKRKANEMLREKNEKARLQSEDIRITEEEEREANELERRKAENNRKVSESNRKVSENTRVTNERAREEAELSRQSTFEENEEIRNSNENLRIESEKERIKFNNKAKTDEVNRKEAETKRVEAEKTRVIAEDERKKAETSRQEAEDIRQNTYTNFNEAEEERRNNEISRQEAEALRIEAEKRRDDLYSQKEEERNAAFLESERTRGTAFNEAQNDRNLTFEESEAIREEAFKVSEATRNEAEEGRVEAESERVKSEKARVLADEERNNTFTQNETNRNTTFTQNEEERKGIFEEAENARKVAETKRVEAEKTRVEAEKLRVVAETGRVEAESLRVTAEEERVAAETKREEGFNEFEGRISANTEELKNARSATTGEKFNSLDERIDCEVDRLNKKIDVTMLQQEDKENHTIENTVNGMTTDMIIKGKTLVNVIPKGFKSYKYLATGFSFEGDTFVINGLTSGYQTLFFKDFIFKPNTKYTVIANVEEISLRNEDWRILSVGEGDGADKQNAYPSNNPTTTGIYKESFTTPNVDITDAQIFTRPSANGKSVKIKWLMVLEGDWTNKTIPQYFEGIKSFGQQEDKISILPTGKNLAKLDLSNKNITPFEDGYRLDCLALYRGDEDIFDLKGKYKENTQYVLSYYGKILDNSNANNYRIRVYYTDNTYTDGVVTGNKYEKRIIKTLSGKTVYKIIGYYGAMNGDFIVKDVMLEEGTQATQYEPYKCNKKDILIKEPLRSVGNIQDVLYEDNGQVKINRYSKQYLITGDENIQTNSNFYTNKTLFFFFDLQNANKKSSSINICNRFPSYPTDMRGIIKNQQGEGCFIGDNNSGLVQFYINKDKLTTPNVDGFKEWLKANPTTIVYQLATPTVEIVENCVDINLKTFGEKTYVSFENALSGTSSFKAPVDSAGTIARLNRENRDLEEENKTLRQDFESTTLSLTDSDLELVKQNVDIDFRLMEVEFALDIPQSTLSSKFKKKGEVKSMARTPYQMLKIVILSGDYDREDYIHKVGKYYERGRMTKEEYDELMSLMTADEVISK